MTPPPLLEAFSELFTSRLNIDKFWVNLQGMKDCLLQMALLAYHSCYIKGLTICDYSLKKKKKKKVALESKWLLRPEPNAVSVA